MKIEKEAEQLILNFYKFINWLDEEMKNPSSEERGKRIARAINRWEIHIDSFAHYTLKLGFKKIENMKKRARNA